MCAIFGVLDYRGNLEAVQRLRLVKALGNAAEVRGIDATGIAFFQRDKLCIQKAAKPAHKMKYRTPAEVRYIMGHIGKLRTCVTSVTMATSLSTPSATLPPMLTPSAKPETTKRTCSCAPSRGIP